MSQPLRVLVNRLIKFKAAIVVSTLISRNQFQRLSGLVLEDSISTIKDNFSKLTPEQKNSIEIKKDDIRFSTPYHFGTRVNEGRTFANLSALFYYGPNTSELVKQADVLKRAQLDETYSEQIKQAQMDAQGFEIRNKIKKDLIVGDYR